jgi:transcription antitermination factor NusA-like protein
MKLPICETDANRAQLCNTCGKMLELGLLTDMDVTVSRALQKMSKTIYLDGIELEKTLQFGDLVILVCIGNVGALIGKGGKVVNQLSTEIGKKVRIVERGKDEKKAIQELLGNVRLIGINTVFAPGKQLKKITIAANDRKKLFTDKINLEKTISKIIDNSDIVVEFA